MRSTATSLSIHSAPALRRSVLSEGHAAMRRPRAAPVSMMVQGPWQMAATGLLASKQMLDESDSEGIGAQLVRIHDAAGKQQRVVRARRCAFQGNVYGEVLALFGEIPATNLFGLRRDDVRCGVDLAQSRSRLGHFDLLKSVFKENGDFQPAQRRHSVILDLVLRQMEPAELWSGKLKLFRFIPRGRSGILAELAGSAGPGAPRRKRCGRVARRLPVFGPPKQSGKHLLCRSEVPCCRVSSDSVWSSRLR